MKARDAEAALIAITTPIQHSAPSARPQTVRHDRSADPYYDPRHSEWKGSAATASSGEPGGGSGASRDDSRLGKMAVGCVAATRSDPHKERPAELASYQGASHVNAPVYADR